MSAQSLAARCAGRRLAFARARAPVSVAMMVVAASKAIEEASSSAAHVARRSVFIRHSRPVSVVARLAAEDTSSPWLAGTRVAKDLH